MSARSNTGLPWAASVALSLILAIPALAPDAVAQVTNNAPAATTNSTPPTTTNPSATVNNRPPANANVNINSIPPPPNNANVTNPALNNNRPPNTTVNNQPPPPPSNNNPPAVTNNRPPASTVVNNPPPPTPPSNPVVNNPPAPANNQPPANNRPPATTTTTTNNAPPAANKAATTNPNANAPARAVNNPNARFMAPLGVPGVTGAIVPGAGIGTLGPFAPNRNVQPGGPGGFGPLGPPPVGGVDTPTRPQFGFAPPPPPGISTPEYDALVRQFEQQQAGAPPTASQNPSDPQNAVAAAAAPPARVIRPPAALPAKRPGTGVPPPGEARLVPDEVVFEVNLATPPAAIAALELGQNLLQLDQLISQLSGTNLLRARIQDGRTVAAVVAALEANPAVMSAQPNYLFALQQQSAPREAPAGTAQYALAKLRLPQAHQLATGDKVLVAVIDSGVDGSHPELTGAIADTFDTLDGSRKPDSHGTAISSLVVAHAKLTGAAPAARILAVRAFDASGAGTQGSTFDILKGLDWAAVHGARIINMSFAGPSDPAIHRGLESAFKNDIVLIAAAGNAGPKSPPLYPGADPSVIAVTATDAQDKYYAASNRGRYIGVAAPGVDILVAAPGGRYQISSGTSFSAAEVTGIAALILERKPNLRPDAVRGILLATGKPLPPEGARLADALQAVSTDRLVLPVAAR